jgi:hypothetical protein
MKLAATALAVIMAATANPPESEGKQPQPKANQQEFVSYTHAHPSLLITARPITQSLSSSLRNGSSSVKCVMRC